MSNLHQDIKSHIYGYLHYGDKAFIKNRLEFDQKLCTYLVKCGYLNLLKLTWNNLYSHNSYIVAAGAYRDHFETIKWLLANNCPPDDYIVIFAARNGNLEMLQWAQISGYKINANAFKYAAENNQIAILKWLLSIGINDVNSIQPYALCNSDTIRFLIASGHQLTAEVYSAAAKIGDISLLMWLQELGCPWSESTCTYAVKHLNALKWLRANGCPWDGKACDWAAKENLETLQWLRANGFSWDEETCASAAGSGRLDILMWA